MAGKQSTKQAAIPTTVDKDTLRRVIGDMFKELRDNGNVSSSLLSPIRANNLPAITGVEDQARYLRWTTKTNPTDEYYFNFEPSVLGCDVNGGLPEGRWDDSVLEYLYRGLADNKVEVQVLGEGREPIRHGSVAPGNKKPRVHDRLRDRLLQTIGKTIKQCLHIRFELTLDE